MKSKKLLSIILATVLLVGCISLQVSAADTTATISLVGEKQAIVGAEYEVVLNVKETSADLVGGISADVIYDSAKFKLERVEISSDFATANSINEATNAINTSTAGKITVVLLDAPNDESENNWLTFVFTVKESIGTAQFNLENVNVSDATGSKLITNNLTVDITDNSVYAHMIDVNGASIKKDGAGEIRFEAQLDSTVLEAIKSGKSNIAEIGFMMLPTIYLDNGDLTNTQKYTSLKYGEKSVASDSVKVSDLPKDFDGKFYCYLKQSTTKFKLTTLFSARAFVKLSDGTTYVYSDNQTYDADSETYVKNIKGGTSSKSCIETAKAIYEIYKSEIETDISGIIAKDSKEWSTDDYASVVSALASVEDTSTQW